MPVSAKKTLVLQPTPLADELSLTLAHGVLFVKYASILLQAMTIELDEDFVFALYDFSLFKGASWQEAPEE